MKREYYVNLPKDCLPFDDGNLFVSKDGDIYKKYKNGKYSKVNTTNLGKDKGLRITYTRSDGRDRVRFVHPIVAELYCKKEGLEKTVGAKDGDFTNVNSSNLYWKESREEKRRKSRLLKSVLEIESLPKDYIKVDCLNIFINKQGNVFKKNQNGKYTAYKKYLKVTNNTSAYYINAYDYKTKSSRTIGVHTLLGHAFVNNENPDKNWLVWFKDNNGLNINLNNLYWTSKVEPVHPRRDRLERAFDSIDIRHKDMGDYIITIKGDVFVKDNNKYIKLRHYEQSDNVVVHIPKPNNKYLTRKVSLLMGEAFLEKTRLVSKEVYFKDGNNKNLDLSNLYRKTLLYPEPLHKLENGIENLPEGFFNCKNLEDYFISKDAVVYKKIKDKYYFIEPKQYSGATVRMAFSYKKGNKWKTVGLANIMADTFLNRVGKQKVKHKDGDYRNCKLDNIQLLSDVILIDNKLIDENELGFYKEAPFDAGVYVTKEGKVAQKVNDSRLKKINIHNKQNGKKYFIYTIEKKSYKRDLAKILGQTFLNFPKECCVEYKNNEYGDVSLENLLLSEKRAYHHSSQNPQELVDSIGDDFKECKYDKGLFINKSGEVYQSYQGKYKKLKHIFFNSKKYVYISYVKDKKNYNRIVSRLLMQTFFDMSLEQGVIHIDGDYHNIELSNLKIVDKGFRIHDPRNTRTGKLIDTAEINNSYKECPFDKDVYITREGKIALRIGENSFKEKDWHDYNGQYFVFLNRKKRSVIRLLAQTYLDASNNTHVGCVDGNFHNVVLENIKISNEKKYKLKNSIDHLPEEYVECRGCQNLFINKNADVLYEENNRYYPLKKRKIKRKSGISLYVYYGQKKKKSVAKLLVENFINKTDNIFSVTYKDGNHSNLTLENLDYSIVNENSERKARYPINNNKNIEVIMFGTPGDYNLDNYTKADGFNNLYVSKNGESIVEKDDKFYDALLEESYLHNRPCKKIVINNSIKIYLPHIMLYTFKKIKDFKKNVFRYKDGDYSNCSIENLELINLENYVTNEEPYDCIEYKKGIYVSRNGVFYIKKNDKYHKKDMAFGFTDTGSNILVNAKEINKTLSAKRIIAETYVENPNNYKYIYYKDGNYHNISSDNLDWTDKYHQQENLYCIECGNRYRKIGIHQGMCPKCSKAIEKLNAVKIVDPLLPKLESKGLKITDIQRQYLELHDKGNNTQEIANILGVTRQAVSLVILRAKKKLESEPQQKVFKNKKIQIDQFKTYNYKNISYEEYCAIFDRVKSVAGNSPVIITKKIAKLIDNRENTNIDLDELIITADKELELSRKRRNKNTKDYPYGKYLSLKVKNLKFDEYLLILDECSHYDIDKYKLAKAVSKKIDIFGFDNSNVEYEVRTNFLILSKNRKK